MTNIKEKLDSPKIPLYIVSTGHIGNRINRVGSSKVCSKDDSTIKC